MLTRDNCCRAQQTQHAKHPVFTRVLGFLREASRENRALGGRWRRIWVGQNKRAGTGQFWRAPKTVSADRPMAVRWRCSADAGPSPPHGKSQPCRRVLDSAAVERAGVVAGQGGAVSFARQRGRPDDRPAAQTTHKNETTPARLTPCRGHLVKVPAATYSPKRLPTKYHRRRRA